MRKRTLLLLTLLGMLGLASAGNVIILNPGCRQFDASGACVACSTRFYRDADGICQPVNSNCRTYRPENGACTSCYDGFSIVQDACLPKSAVDDLLGIYSALANCNELGDNGTCKRCSQGYYFDVNKFCKKIPDTCANFNSLAGQCMGCYPGYALNNNNECTISTQVNADPGCNKFQNGKCIKCSYGYYFDANKQCKVIPPSCQNFDTVNFRCGACYPGYALDGQYNCVQSVPQAVDPGCAKFQNNKCTKCSKGYYFNRQSKCKMIPATCSNFNTASETCLGCYPGYSLSIDGGCIESVAGLVDLGCSRFENGKCVKCSFGFYFDKKGACKAVPATCGNFDTVKEVCNACYPGYVLDLNGNCVVSTTTVSDPGCNAFENGRCIKCSFGYYFDRNRVCKLIPPTCKDYDTAKEVCNACYPGYALDDSKSCIQSITTVSDPGCSRFQNGKCIKCSVGFYFNRNGVCKTVPPTCSKFDSLKEECLGCYAGYALDQSKTCVVSVNAVGDLGCSRFEQGKCLACSAGYYFNQLGICQQIPSTCSNFDTMIGVCRGCYQGYELNAKNECVVNQSGTITDLNCREFKNGKCVQCSAGAYFDSFGKCILADPLCKKLNQVTKRCQECYPGFSLDSVKFVCSETPASALDPNCKTFKNNECQECSFRFFKDVDGLCKSVDPSCRLFNLKTGECNGCYDGYKLANKKCEKDNIGVSDLNCAEWLNGKCSKCAFGAYFGPTGACTLVDPLCMTWNDANGACKSCYPSFELSNGKCIASTKNYDQNCAKFTSKGECIQCSKGFYFNANTICTQVDPLCASFDSKFGRCLTCYPGYKASNGKCVEDVQAISDLNCAQFKNSVCQKCSQGFYFDQGSKCRAINPQCRYFDTAAMKCGDCYPGYVLFNGECVVGTKDNLCAEWKEGICLRCVHRAYFNDQGGCNLVSQYCNAYNVFDGSCESCYGGFDLSNGSCKRQTESNGCIEYSKDAKCLQCEKRRYLNNDVCLKIDDLCEEFNFIKKTCSRCYKGYTLVNDKCIIAEVKADAQVQNCFTYSLQGACIECFDRYFLQANRCQQVSVFCKKYNQNSGDCTDCYSGFKLDTGKCVRK